jgi:hypothetical protein
MDNWYDKTKWDKSACFQLYLLVNRQKQQPKNNNNLGPDPYQMTGCKKSGKHRVKDKPKFSG